MYPLVSSGKVPIATHQRDKIHKNRHLWPATGCVSLEKQIFLLVCFTFHRDLRHEKIYLDRHVMLCVDKQQKRNWIWYRGCLHYSLTEKKQNIKVEVLRDKDVFGGGESRKVFRTYLFAVDNKFKAKRSSGMQIVAWRRGYLGEENLQPVLWHGRNSVDFVL